MMPVRYRISIPKATATVRATACITMPGYWTLKIAEMPPTAKPSQMAYSGAVIGAQVGLKGVAIPKIKPP
jgi:hypothetical protein